MKSVGVPGGGANLPGGILSWGKAQGEHVGAGGKLRGAPMYIPAYIYTYVCTCLIPACASEIQPLMIYEDKSLYTPDL